MSKWYRSIRRQFPLLGLSACLFLLITVNMMMREEELEDGKKIDDNVGVVVVAVDKA
jgi:hypothetical protein